MQEGANSEIRTVGIPRALLAYRYGIFWKTFLEELGFEVVFSEETNRIAAESGDSASIDEACLASKVFMGHVAELAGHVDAVFIPSFESVNARAGFCTKFQSLPDMVSNTFRNIDKVAAGVDSGRAADGIRVLSLDIKDATNDKKTKRAYIDFASGLGFSAKKARQAYASACEAQATHDMRLAMRTQETLALIEEYRELAGSDPSGNEMAPLLIMLAAHPYIAHDPYVCGDIVRAIEDAGGVVVFADEFDHARSFERSFEFSETLPWVINRELAGAALELKDKVDGIVAVSAFPCGPDSMFVDALMRRVQGPPMVHLVIDAQNGSAGMQTRIESFMDILRFKREGGYLDD